MRTILCVILFILILTIKADSYGCLVWNNIYLFYQNSSTENQTIHIYTSPRQSYLRIDFFSIDRTYPLLSMEYTIKNLSYSFISTTNQVFTYNIDQSTYFMIDNILHIEFNILMETLESFTYVGFSQSVTGNANQLDYIGGKDMPFFNPKSNFESGWCDPRYLKLAGRLLAQNVYTFVFGISVGLILMVLCVYFREYQPMKSRGLGPILVIFFLSTNLLTDYLSTNAITYEQYYYVDCFINIFVLYPCSMIS